MPDPFITLQDLTDYLGRDVTADDGAVIALDAACDIVRTVTERQFNAGTTTFTLDGTGTDALLLPELPVTAAGTVLVDGTAIEDGYALNSNGILFRGSAGADPRSVWPSGRQNITVTAEHGYSTVDLPRDVKMVALQIASRLVVQGVAMEESVGSVSVKYAVASTDLTAGEKIILRKYKSTR
jgi:hypothetical protein